MNPTDELASSLSGEQIAQVLRSSGPVISCVLLRSKPSNAATEDSKTGGHHDGGVLRHDENSQEESHDSTKEETTKVGDNRRRVLEELMEEIQIDTTPKKQMVSQVLGGPFTFLGQYEDEGIVVIVRKTNQDGTCGNDGENDDEEEKEEENELPLNPHILQPPLHNVQVRGDILLMRVAAVEEGDEEGDEEEEEKEEQEESNDGDDKVQIQENQQQQHHHQETTKDETPPKPVVDTTKFLSNEDFFLDYTKEEYIKFASRTDIVAEPSDENDEESEESLNDEDYEEEEEEDGDYNVESDEDDGFDVDDEECQVGMMNLILAQLLRRFREEHGRGPNTTELLTMRSALAAKLGIDERLVNEECQDTGEESGYDKRKLDSDDQGTEQHREKKVKFTNQDEVKIMTDDEAALDHSGSNNK